MPEAIAAYRVIEEKKIPVYSSPEEFYREHTADLAIISTPIHLHYHQITTCLKNGSHVLTEKPVCTSVEGAGRLMDLERETGRFVSVGYQLNYSGDVLALKKDILDGRFGKMCIRDRPISMPLDRSLGPCRTIFSITRSTGGRRCTRPGG